MELFNRRFADLVQPEWLSAVVAGGVAVTVGDQGLSGFRSKPSGCLNRMDVYELLLAGSGIQLSYSRAGRLSGPSLQISQYAFNPGYGTIELFLLCFVKARRKRLPEDLPYILQGEEGFVCLLNLYALF